MTEKLAEITKRLDLIEEKHKTLTVIVKDLAENYHTFTKGTVAALEETGGALEALKHEIYNLKR